MAKHHPPSSQHRTPSNIHRREAIVRGIAHGLKSANLSHCFALFLFLFLFVVVVVDVVVLVELECSEVAQYASSPIEQ
jgi:hypothetical protein